MTLQADKGLTLCLKDVSCYLSLLAFVTPHPYGVIY